MDGIADIGGMEGLGPVVVEQDEPVFHSDWERRAMGITFASFAFGLSNGGQFRYAIERMDTVHYLTSRYYEHWLTAVATRLVETGAVSIEELGPGFPLSRPELVSEATLPPAPQGFAVGDSVRVAIRSPRGHTRCPRYVRGRAGVVVRVDPPASVPDLEAHGGRRKEPMYCVRFSAEELWGEGGAGAGAAVHVDLWESYLEAA